MPAPVVFGTIRKDARRIAERSAEIFLRPRRQAALASATVVLAQMRKVPFAGKAGDRTIDGWFAALFRRVTKEPRVIPKRFLQRRLHPKTFNTQSWG